MKRALLKGFQMLVRNIAGHGWGLGRIPVFLALYRFIERYLRPSGIALIDVPGHKMYVDTRDRGVAPSLIRFGTYAERAETELFKRIVRPGMIVLDVGANIGFYTLIAAGLVGEKGCVYAFEPAPHNFELLTRNLEINGYRNVVPLPFALSRSPGKMRLYIDKVNFGNPSFSKENTLISEGFADVDTLTLDQLTTRGNLPVAIEAIDVIKMDAQGAEGLIFEGGKNTLARQNPMIMLEFWPFGLKNMGTDPLAFYRQFSKFGFSVLHIDAETKTLKAPSDEEICRLCEANDKAPYLNLLLTKNECAARTL